jgi:pimeloyl-ACP methyl ester carboxylesterase
MADLHLHTAPTLVFVHGVLDDAAVWRGVTSALQVPDSEVVAVDLAGMSGRPGEPGPYSLDGYAKDVAAALDGISGPVVLIGHSMGAQIVELAAIARPDKVIGLVLIAPIHWPVHSCPKRPSPRSRASAAMSRLCVHSVYRPALVSQNQS